LRITQKLRLISLKKTVTYLLLLSILIIFYLFTNQYQLNFFIRVDLIFLGYCFVIVCSVLMTRFYTFFEINNFLKNQKILPQESPNKKNLINFFNNDCDYRKQITLIISSLIEDNHQLSNKVSELNSQIEKDQLKNEQDLKFHYIGYLVGKCRGITNSLVQREPKVSEFGTALSLTLNEIVKIINQEKTEIPDPCLKVSDIFNEKTCSIEGLNESSYNDSPTLINSLKDVFNYQALGLQEYSPPLLIDYTSLFQRCGKNERRLKMVLKLFSDNLEDVLTTVDNSIKPSDSIDKSSNGVNCEANQSLHKLKGFLLESGCIFEAYVTENLELKSSTMPIEEIHKYFNQIQERVRRLKSLIEPMLSP
jgi:hypothetical protein